MLSTQYAAVIAPYKGAHSPVVSARMLRNDGATGAMAVEVKFKNRADYIISTKDSSEGHYGPVTMSGHFGFVSVDGRGKVLQAYLLNGTALKAAQTEIVHKEPSTKTAVSAVEATRVLFATPLDPAIPATARYMLAPGPPPIREGMPRLQTGFGLNEITRDHAVPRDYPVVSCREVTLLHSRLSNSSAWWQKRD